MSDRAFPLLGPALYFLLLIGVCPARSQSLSLSVGVAGGYAPLLNYGTYQEAGAEIALFGDCEYGRVIGRLQFTDVLTGTVGNDKLKSGYAIHGSLGYNAPITTQIHIPIMLTGGAGFVKYSNSVGIGDNTFFDVSPQIGLTFSPYYQLTDSLALHLAFRYIQGFASGEGSSPIIMADALIGVRYSLL